MFRQATKQQSKLRMTIDGPAGSGKTYTALRFAHALAAGGKIGFIDTERGSASKYVGEAPDGIPWAFDVLELTQFSPERYTEAIQAAVSRGYSVLVIDSLSHAWEGSGGALDMKQKAGESWSAWRFVTPVHNRMIDSILQSPIHVITTMRSRMEYVQDEDEKGKKTIRKIGLSPIQRPGMEYEFDLVCDIDWSHMLTVSKSRCSAVADMTIDKPGPAFLQPVIAWLEGEPVQYAAQPIAHKTIDAPAPTLEDLLNKYGAEAILAANNGIIPSSDEELLSVAATLAAQ